MSSTTDREQLKTSVKEKYGSAALRVTEGDTAACMLRLERMLRRDDRSVGSHHRRSLRRRTDGRDSRRGAARVARLRQPYRARAAQRG